MYLKYSIALLLGTASAEKYQLTMDGPCEDKPDFEKLMPLLIGAHKPLEEPGCFENGAQHKYTYEPAGDKCNVDFEINKGNSSHHAWKNLERSPVVPMTEMRRTKNMNFTIQQVRQHPNVAVSDSTDHQGALFPAEDSWNTLSVNQAYHQVLYPNMVLGYALSFLPIPVVRQLIAGSYDLLLALDIGPKLNQNVEGFSNVWDVTIRNVEIWNAAYWFFAAFCDLFGFPLGTVAFFAGLGEVLYGVFNTLDGTDSSNLQFSIEVSKQDTDLIVSGGTLMVLGLGVSAINLPVQLLASIFGGVQWADVQNTYDNVNSSKKGGECNCNGNGGVVCCCCASEYGGSACECGESDPSAAGGGSGGSGGGSGGGAEPTPGGGGAEPTPQPSPAPEPAPAPQN